MNQIVSRMRRCPLQTLSNCSRALLTTPKHCYPPSSYSTTLSSTELSTEDGLSPPAQERVLSLLSLYKDLPSFKKSKQLSLDRVTSWVDTGSSGYIHPSTYNFLLHVCVSCGSADDLDIAMAVAQRQKLELNESEMNSVLTSLSRSAELSKVKETMNNMSNGGLKIRLNTLTSLLQRGVNERDFSFTLEIIDIMRRNNFFPSSPVVICDAIRACVGVESSEAVRVVEGVMALHNSYSMAVPRRQVDQETATEFSNWITSSPKENRLTHTRVNERCVCESCGEKLLNNKLTSEERDTLIRYFKDEISADISTGSEAAKEKHFMRKFLEYVNENTERFGAVVDGLNVAYLCKRKKEVAFETMLAICRELVSVTGKEVLMVGREHILRTLAAGRMSPDSVQEEYKSHGVQFVPLRNSTPDDRYILYAAMVTNSVILSNDKFGYEMDRVNRDEIAKLVRKWLDGSHAKINIDRNAIKLFFPTTLQRAVQWTDNGWHLPLETSSSKNWLCARSIES